MEIIPSQASLSCQSWRTHQHSFWSFFCSRLCKVHSMGNMKYYTGRKYSSPAYEIMKQKNRTAWNLGNKRAFHPDMWEIYQGLYHLDGIQCENCFYFLLLLCRGFGLCSEATLQIYMPIFAGQWVCRIKNLNL